METTGKARWVSHWEDLAALTTILLVNSKTSRLPIQGPSSQFAALRQRILTTRVFLVTIPSDLITISTKKHLSRLQYVMAFGISVESKIISSQRTMIFRTRCF